MDYEFEKLNPAIGKKGQRSLRKVTDTLAKWRKRYSRVKETTLLSYVTAMVLITHTVLSTWRFTRCGDSSWYLFIDDRWTNFAALNAGQQDGGAAGGPKSRKWVRKLKGFTSYGRWSRSASNAGSRREKRKRSLLASVGRKYVKGIGWVTYCC